MEQELAIEILASYIPNYTEDFEELYKLYDNEKGSKERAFKIFQRKWEKADFKALKTVMKMYLEDLELRKHTNFKPHFENFLHNRLEEYILKKQKEV